MRPVHVALAAFLSIAGGAPGVDGDTVRTLGGSEHEGVVRLDVLRLTGAEGDIEVPRSAIREIRVKDDELHVVLVDDTVVAGRPGSPVFEVEVGLIVRTIPFAEVELIRFDPAPPEAGIEAALKSGDFVPAGLATPEMGKIQTTCPMRLLLELPERLPATAWRTNALRPFVCEGVVSVPSVILEAREPKRGMAELRLQFFVLVLPPQDKLSRLGVEVLLDSEVVAKGGRADVSTEEGRSTPVRISLDLAPADDQRWRRGVEEAVLKLTLAAVDD